MSTHEGTATVHDVDARVLLGGTWRNELGSSLHLSSAPEGELGGTYRSAVGIDLGTHRLVGLHGPVLADGSVDLGFVVQWPLAGSVGTWTGRYDPMTDRIQAMWVLVSERDPHLAWRATNVGFDQFFRV